LAGVDLSKKTIGKLDNTGGGNKKNFYMPNS